MPKNIVTFSDGNGQRGGVCIGPPPKCVADIFSLAPNLGAPAFKRQFEDHRHSCAVQAKFVRARCSEWHCALREDTFQ